MEKNRLIYNICFIALIAFSVLGATGAAITAHEYSHYFDLRDYATPNTSAICALNLPVKGQAISLQAALGYYQQDYDTTNATVVANVNRINQYTELKAYAITFAMIFIWLVCLIVILKKKVEEDVKHKWARQNTRTIQG